MDNKQLELIDTALKIGLGSLITVFGTVTVVLLTQRHDFKKEQNRRRLDGLEKVTKSMSRVFMSCIRQMMVTQQALRHKGNQDMKEFFECKTFNVLTAVEETVSAVSELNEMVMTLRMLGRPKEADELRACVLKLGRMTAQFTDMLSGKSEGEIAMITMPEVNNIEGRFYKILDELAKDYSGQK